MIDANKIADEIMDEMYSYFDHYYISDGGYKQMAELMATIIRKEVSIQESMN